MMKAEKYLITIETKSSPDQAEPSSGLAASVSDDGVTTTNRVRYGFGAAGEEVQKILELAGVVRVRVRIEGTRPEVVFTPGKPYRLLDLKQKIKQLSFDV